MPDVLQHFGHYSDLFDQVGAKVLFSVFCGGMIGLERELKQKPAGIKTNMLICLGSCLFTSVSILMATRLSDQGHYGDPTRIAAQIVSGIGFLGGGAILHARGIVVGLTTAATIWVVAAVGVCIGLGYPGVGVTASLTVLLILVGTSWIEEVFLGRALEFQLDLAVAGDSENFETIKAQLQEAFSTYGLRLETFAQHRAAKELRLRLIYRGHRKAHQRLVRDIWSWSGILEVKG
jgi:uncharacterized membrane protein YhiD involved in acid resistance